MTAFPRNMASLDKYQLFSTPMIHYYNSLSMLLVSLFKQYGMDDSEDIVEVTEMYNCFLAIQMTKLFI